MAGTAVLYTIPYAELRMQDIADVGGKNASLGELISQLSTSGVRVPDGFATTAAAFRAFVAYGGLAQKIAAALRELNPDDIGALMRTGNEIRNWIMQTPFPAELTAAIAAAYAKLDGGAGACYAVRSSATAEDLADASFAGQQETYLNIAGLDNILNAIRAVYASLYNDRAIAYRAHQGYADIDVALSAGVQRMVRSDLAVAGVMFSIDTESGFRNAVFITASYGLGESVVQGAVNPDEFYVHKSTLSVIRRSLGSKQTRMVFGNSAAAGLSTRTEEVPDRDRHAFALSDAELKELAEYAIRIEQHYGRPMDIEWGKDGIDGELYILQARPETVQSQRGGVIEKYRLQQHSRVLVSGRAIGQKIGAGRVCIVHDPAHMDRVQLGDILVADMTDPNWEPIMKRAAAIVTNRGGRTCHAAIIARELGIPAIVGCGDATEVLQEREPITVCCAEGDTGYVYRGELPFDVQRQDMGALPALPLKLTMNVGNPELAFSFAQLPNEGVGLARIEFVINNMIGVHPKAVLEIDRVPANLRDEIHRRARGYASPRDFFVNKLAEGVATIAAAFYPKPVIVRLSDFKSNEYRKLLGGTLYEPEEENPMLGFRGASRYIAPDFHDCFAMETEALKKVRNELKLTNVELMVPFVRRLDEAKGVIELLAAHGLKRGENGLRIVMMCEIPSNALLAEQFLEYFDGFSIGSNDMTQLCLGVDRDSGLVAQSFDERDPSVKALLAMAIRACNAHGKYVGICGQGPSDHPDFAIWLMQEGIQSLSLNPDTVVDTWLRLAEVPHK